MKIKPYVLVIEDDNDLGRLYKLLVEMAGGVGELCRDGAEGLKRIKDPPIPHLIFLDLHLPNANGQDILTVAKRDPRYGDTLFVIVTADVLLARQMEDEGVTDAVLVKPVDVATYYSWIKRAGEIANVQANQLVENKG